MVQCGNKHIGKIVFYRVSVLIRTAYYKAASRSAEYVGRNQKAKAVYVKLSFLFGYFSGIYIPLIVRQKVSVGSA